jgi:hypothetical protein
MIEHLRKEIDLKTKIVNAWPETKPWINETEQGDVAKAITEFAALVHEKEADQAKKQPHEAPAYLVNDLAVQFDKVDKLFTRISHKKKPKPSPSPFNETTANGTDSNSTDTSQTDSSKGSEGATSDKEPEASKGKADGKDAKAEAEKKAKAEAEKKAKAEAEKKAKAEAEKKEEAKSKKPEASKEKAQAEAKRKEELKKKMEDKKKKSEDKKTRSEL